MNSLEGEHVTGRRLDVNGSNLVLFRGADPKLSSINPKRTNDQDMLDYVRAQEQKLKLEKLKWHENNARIVALQSKPAGTAAKSTPPPKETTKKVIKPLPVEIKKPVKERLSPKHVAELVENRNKRASQWLHQEQKEHQSKKAELLEHKKAVKELDQKRRAAQQMEAERRRQKQLQLLYEDPVVSSILPPVAEYNATASAGSLPMRASKTSAPLQASNAVPAPTPADEVRASYDTVVIQQLASQLQLHPHPENELMMHKRPGVPRLSKSFVNRNSLVHSDTEVAGSTAEATGGAGSSSGAGGVTLMKREKAAASKRKGADSDDDSDGYGDDADFESKDGQADSAANNQLVQKVLQNDRYRRHNSVAGRVTSDQEADDSDFESHTVPASAPSDRITERSEAVLQKRREDGRQYAEKQMAAILHKEEEARRQKALEEQKRRESLSQLKQRVLSINKRSKHYSSSSSQQGSNANFTNSTGTPGGSSIRALLTPACDREDEHQVGSGGGERPSDGVAPPPLRSHIAELVLNKYDYLPRQMIDAEEEDTVNIDDTNSNDVDLPEPRHVRLQEHPTDKGDRDPINPSGSSSSSSSRGGARDHRDLRDLKDLDPAQVGGWNRFMELEKARAALHREESQQQGMDTTPPRSHSSVGRPTSAPSSSQSRNRRSSPPLTRPTTEAAGVGAGTSAGGVGTSAASQPRKPTPPPFRFNSWQAAPGAGKRNTAGAALAAVEAHVPFPRPRHSTGGTGPSRFSRSGPTTTAGGKSNNTHARKAPSKSRPFHPSGAGRNSRGERGRSVSAPRGGGRPTTAATSTARSTSTGAAGMRMRRSAAGRYDDFEDAAAVGTRQRHHSSARSRSVFDDDNASQSQEHLMMLGGDMLDLLDRDRISDNDAYDDNEHDNDDDFDAHAAPMPPQVSQAPGHSVLGGYLSRSPARDFLASHQHYQGAPAPLYAPSPAAAAVLQEISTADPYGSEEQKLMEDVSLQAIQNFEQVNRVLQDVDRWCERAKHETLELQERLRLRESTESLVARAAPAPAPAPCPTISSAPPRPEPSANCMFSPPDEKSIAQLRRSLTDRLAVNVPGLFMEADSSRSSGGSSDDSLEHEQERDEGLRMSRSGDDSQESPRQASDQWTDRLSPSRMASAAHPVIQQSSQQTIHSFRTAASEEKKNSLEDTEDNVLIGETDESGADDDNDSDHSDSRDYINDNHDGDMPSHQFQPPAPASSRGGASAADLFLLNTDRPDRPIVWAPRDGHQQRSAEGMSRDPLLAQQLGMMADRNDILAKYSKLDLSVSDGNSKGGTEDYPTYRAPFVTEDDWTQPMAATTTSAGQQRNKSSDLPPYKPSLRNVGELAGLLRSTYRADLSTEVGRRAMLDAADDDDSESDSAGDSSSDTDTGNYDNFSAVSIHAAKMMRAQAAQLKAKEQQLIARSSVDLSTSRNSSSSRSASIADGTAATLSSKLKNSAIQTEDKEEGMNWDDLASRPLKFDVNASARLSVGNSDVPTDEMLHDYIMNARYGTAELESPKSDADEEGAFPGPASLPSRGGIAGSTDAPAAAAARPQKVRYSGAELRMRMMDELRKQDELFNYTVELSELEKANALQSARDLAMQAQQRTAQEFAKLQQQKELDLQRLAYENSLALSLVNAQAQMDQHAADQREQMIQMQSQLGVQEMFRQYQELLHQADHVAGSLEHNQKLLQLEKMLQEDRARDAVAHLESKHATERAALVMAHAEAQQAQAEALATASRMSIERRSASVASPVRASRDKTSSTQTAPAALRYSQQQQQDSSSYEEEFEEEYSVQFENDASMSMSMRSRTGGVVPSTSVSASRPSAAARSADLSGSDSIPEDDSISEPALHHNHSLSVSDSVMYSPDKSVKYQPSRTAAQASKIDDSIRSEVEDSIRSSGSSAKRAGRYGASGSSNNNNRHNESAGSDIEDAAEAEIAESQESVFESYEDTFVSMPSPPHKSAAEILRAAQQPAQAQLSQSQQSVASESYSQSRVSGVSRSQSHSQSRGPSFAPAAAANNNRSRVQESSLRSAADFEVSDEVIEEDEASIAEDIDEEPGDEYSDTFEFSGSKGSKSLSSGGSSSSKGKVKVPAAGRPSSTPQTGPGRYQQTQQMSSAITGAVPRSSIAALDSSTEGRDPVFADGGHVAAVLDEYRAEMEQRLRAQEKTYKLKVQFLKAKQSQRLEWLEKVRQNKQISPTDIQEEAARINDTYAEERAEVERERWALNARAYKELRKFKRLRKELFHYQVNMQNSAEAAAELEASLLNLKKKENTLQQGTSGKRVADRDWYRQSKAALGGGDSSEDESVTSSSDGHMLGRKLKAATTSISRRQASTATTVAKQPAQAHPVKAPTSETRVQTSSATENFEIESEVEEVGEEVQYDEDDVYGADEFERTFSTANASPVKKSATTATSSSNRYDVSQSQSQSEAYGSATFEKSTSAAAPVGDTRSLGRSQDSSSASEVPSEIEERSFDDSIGEEEDEDERKEEKEEGARSPFGADAGRSRGEDDDLVETGEADAVYEDEDFEDTGAQDANAALSHPHLGGDSIAAAPVTATMVTPATAQQAQSSPQSAVASPDEEEYSSYGDDDFVDASDHSRDSRSSKGSQRAAGAVSGVTAVKDLPESVPAADEQSAASDEISEEIEEDIAEGDSDADAQSDASDARSESKRAGDQSQHESSAGLVGTSTALETLQQNQDQSEDEDGEKSQQELSPRLDIADSPNKPSATADHQHAASSSFQSTGGSIGASAKEDEDEVMYGDDDFDEYPSDYESDPEQDKQAQEQEQRSVPAAHSPASPTAVPAPISKDAKADAEDDADSIATDISEEEGLAASFAEQRRAGSDADSESGRESGPGKGSPTNLDTLDTTTGAPADDVAANTGGVSDGAAEGGESTTLAVETIQAEAADDVITPMSSGEEQRSLRPPEYANDENIEFWGSDDFAESPAVFDRKRSALLIQQASSDTVFQDADEGASKKMFFDPDQQRWVGGEDVSLDGFDESVDAATENDKELSSNQSITTPGDRDRDLPGGSSADSSIADRPDLSRDVSFEKEGIAERRDMNGSTDQDDKEGGGGEEDADDDLVVSAYGSYSQPGSPVKAVAAVEDENEEGDAYESDESSVDEEHGQERVVAESAKASVPEVVPEAGKDADGDDGETSEVEEDFEIPDEIEEQMESSAEEGDSSALNLRSAQTGASGVDATNLTTLSAVSAVSAVDDSNIDDISASQLSELLAADLLLDTDNQAGKPAAALEDAHLLSAEQDAMDGNLTDYSFDYQESAKPIVKGGHSSSPPMSPSSGAASPAHSPVMAAKPAAAPVIDDDSFMDLELELAELQGDFDQDKGAAEQVSMSSEATEFADLSELVADYMEENWQQPRQESTTGATEQREARQKQEQEKRLVLVDDVTDTILNALVGAECARVVALVPVSNISNGTTATTNFNAAESKHGGEEIKSVASPAKEADADLEFAADLLAENMIKKSSKFAPKESAPEPGTEVAPQKLGGLPSSKSSLSSLSSLSALPSLSLSGKKSLPLPSLSESKQYSNGDDEDDDGQDEGGSSSSLMLPAEFEDEELYEFDIPTTKTVATTPHSSTGGGDSDSEESRAGAALAASILAAEAAKSRSQRMLAETKAFVDEVLSEPDLNLAELLGDQNHQGCFVSIPEDALLPNISSAGDVHAVALRDRINEICQEIFKAKHGTAGASLRAAPFEKLTLMRALPLRNDAIKAHIAARVLAEQQDLAQVLSAAAGDDQQQHQQLHGSAEVQAEVRAIDTFKQEAAREIQLASEQMADALLARCLIETIAELGQQYDLAKYFK